LQNRGATWRAAWTKNIELEDSHFRAFDERMSRKIDREEKKARDFVEILSQVLEPQHFRTLLSYSKGNRILDLAVALRNHSSSEAEDVDPKWLAKRTT